MQQICHITGEKFEITESDLEFYRKMGVPIPTLCPEERFRRRLAWRNMHQFYHRKCDATGKKIISNYSPEKPFPIFEKNYWLSHDHNALSYGKDFNFTRPFFEQFKELQNKVPRFAMQQQEPMENSEYCSFASNCKNSYLIFDSDFCEDSLYSYILKHSNTCCDDSYVTNSELLYECIDCENSFDLRFSQNCKNCSESYFLKNCIGCQHCFGCVNLRNKKYYFSNKKCTKAEYEKKIDSLELQKYSRIKNMREGFLKFASSIVHKAIEGTQNENVSGNYISNSRSVICSYNISECWDIAYCDSIHKAKNCYDVSSFGENIEMIYECSTAGLATQNCSFCFTVVQGSADLTYCDTAYSSRNCFGCIGIQRAEYCILNKQYTKKEYEELVPKIIEHMKKTKEWGEFFPIELSPFAYNETMAQEYLPLPKPIGMQDPMPFKYKWKEEEVKARYSGEKYILPDTSANIPSDICGKIISCEECEKHYRFVQPEIQFYQKMNIPLPHKCPNCRHTTRMKLRNPRKLWARTCAECSKEIETTFAPERPEKVLCEECYLSCVN